MAGDRAKIWRIWQLTPDTGGGGPPDDGGGGSDDGDGDGGGGGGEGLRFSFMTEPAAVQCFEMFDRTAVKLQKEMRGKLLGREPRLRGVPAFDALSSTGYRRLEEYRSAVAAAVAAAKQLAAEQSSSWKRQGTRMVACHAPADPVKPIAIYQIAVDYTLFEEDVPPTCFVERGFYRPCDSLPNAGPQAGTQGAETLLSVRAQGLQKFLSENGLWLVTGEDL